MTVQEILDASKCYRGCVNGERATGAIVYLLDQIRVLNGGSELTVQELLDASKCYCVNDEQFQKSVVYLLDQILTG